MSQGFSTKTRERLIGRDGGLCVVCGMPGREKHHRRRRRENWDGLAHSPSNGLTLCGWGNTTGCHGLVHRRPGWARERGYVVSPTDSPVEVPVLHVTYGLIRLDNDGGWTPVKEV